MNDPPARLAATAAATCNAGQTQSTTYCMGYWQVPQNAKRPLAHYATLLPATLRMLAGRRLIFLSDDIIVQRWVETLGRQSGVQVLLVNKPIAALPALEIAHHILRQTERYGAKASLPAQFNQEKGLWHYFRDFQGSGPIAYHKILAIWLSKVLMIGEVIPIDPFGSHYWAWVDATAARFNGQRSNWNFAEAPDRAGVIAHYSSAMRKNARPLSINASFLKGDESAWQRLAALYLEELQLAVEEPYPNDEETLLHNVTQAHPDLFWTLDLDATMIRSG